MSISSFLDKKDSIKNLFNEKNLHRYSANKLTARERLEILFDENSFQEFGIHRAHNCTDFNLQKSEGDGVITGFGTINGRPVCAFSQDFRYIGGSLGKVHAEKITRIQEFAMNSKIPIIGIQDSGGARIQEGANALAGYGEIFHNNVKASGFIPQISVIMGPCAGGAVYSPALTDFIFMSGSESYMFITGPEIVKAVTNENLTKEELGGSAMHSEKSGVCDFVFQNEYDTLMEVKKLLSFIPNHCYGDVPFLESNNNRNLDWLDTFLPKTQNQGYDVKAIIKGVCDDKQFLEVGENFAKNICVGFARIGGMSVGIVANQSQELAGSIDIDASRKAARFIRFCDSFGIPIISFVDVPGFLPGLEQEKNGIIKHGAKLLYAYSEATVPKITIVTRKAYGGAYIVMGSKHLGCDLNYAWPSAEIAVMGAKGAVSLLYKNLTKNEMEEKIQEYEINFSNPYKAASYGFIDDIIQPSKTREVIVNGLYLLKNKSSIKIEKKHDNLPL